MKKFKYLLLVFVAFLTLNMSAKAVTLPELRIVDKNYNVGDVITEFNQYISVDVEKQRPLFAVTAHGNDMPSDENPAGWYVDENNLNGAVWSTSDANIVTVDQNGNITGVNAGEATITVTYNENSVSTKVTVYMKAQNAPSETTPKSEEPIETIGETTPKSEEPTETVGEKQEPTVTPTETNEETKTDVKKEDKGCKLEVYEIVIIACAVVLLITLITVLVIRKKKANKETM